MLLTVRRVGIRKHTGDVVVEDVIFVDGAVDDPLGAFVENQNFPLTGTRQGQRRALSTEGQGVLRVGEVTRRSRSAYIVLGSFPDGVNDGYERRLAILYGSSLFAKGVRIVCIPLPCSLMMDGPSMATVRGEARARG